MAATQQIQVEVSDFNNTKRQKLDEKTKALFGEQQLQRALFFKLLSNYI
jgi:hypothetical protein